MPQRHSDRESVHVWEKLQITLETQRPYSNPYTEVEVWIDLTGPGFSRRIFGFWDGANVYRVRALATAPGEWSWVSGSNQEDDSLNGVQGRFTAVAWTEAEKEENACRRGMLRATPNGHALEYADSTPCFLLGDTWW